MHKEISPQRRAFAKTLRVNLTPAERRLWAVLRAGRLQGLKFKRQVPLDGYVLDFVCYEAKLIVEADGGQHSDAEGDRVRDAHFAAEGYLTLRFWNNDTMERIDSVATRIGEVAGERVSQEASTTPSLAISKT
jgi:very-short-patch-repair endonuclease